MVMKKLLVFFSFVGLFAWSCNKSIDTPVSEEQTPGWHTVTLNASIADVTKTAYAEEKTFTWSAGDQISVLFHNGDVNNFYTLTAAAGGVASTSFSGSVPDGYVIGSSDDGKKYALYPAADHAYDVSKTHKILFEIPQEIDFTASHFSANIPMFAEGDGSNNFAFTPIAGAYKFTFKVADGISKVKLNVSQASSYRYTGKFPYRMANGFIAFEPKDGTGSESEMFRSTTMTANVESNFVSFYMPFRPSAGLKNPTVTVFNADNEYTLYSGSASTSLANTSLTSITVLPTLDLTAQGLGTPIVSAFGITWGAVTAVAAGRSDAPYDGIEELKATADASNLYLLIKVKKASTYYGISGYSHGNLINIYLGNDSSTTEFSWQWTGYYTKKFEGWLLQSGLADYITYQAPGTVDNTVDAGTYLYYELSIPRSLDACLSGTSATVSVEANQQYVEADWAGSATQIGFAPDTFTAPLAVTMPAML